MKPCKACIKEYGEFLCNELGHCVFEGSGEWPGEKKLSPENDCRLLVTAAH